MMSSQSNSVNVALIAGLIVAAIATFALFGAFGESTPVQRAVSASLLVAAVGGFLIWRRNGSRGLPLYTLMVLAIWGAYGPSSLLGTVASRESVGGRVIEPASYDFAMELVFLGVVSMTVGMALRTPAVLERIPVGVPVGRSYMRLLLGIGTALIAMQVSPEDSASSLRAAMILLLTVIPMVILGISYLDILQRGGSTIDRFLCGAFVLASLLRSIGAGWMGPAVRVLLFLGLIYLFERKRVPWAIAIAAFCALTFFQAGKVEFRRVYWNDPDLTRKQNFISRSLYWVNTSLDRWKEALSSPDPKQSVATLLGAVHERGSLYGQTGNIVQMTPSIVPYQGMKLYSYVFISWIPRSLWPNKPTMNEANQFYQRAYLHATERDLATSIAAGFLAESYISFGVAGVIVVMFLIGFCLNCLSVVCLRGGSGSFLQVLGIVLLLNFLYVESQMAQLLSNFVQIIGMSWLILYPVLRVFRPQQVAALQQAPAAPFVPATAAVEAGPA